MRMKTVWFSDTCIGSPEKVNGNWCIWLMPKFVAFLGFLFALFLVHNSVNKYENGMTVHRLAKYNSKPKTKSCLPQAAKLPSPRQKCKYFIKTRLHYYFKPGFYSWQKYLKLLQVYGAISRLNNVAKNALLFSDTNE